MTTKTLQKTWIATGLVAAFGLCAGLALAHGAATAAGTATAARTDTSMSQKVCDTWITTKVKTEFATTRGVSYPDISVDTKDGVVMLTGSVPSQAEKEMAVRTARAVKGVRAVQADKLEVKGPGGDVTDSGTSMGRKVDDTWITAKVKTQFATTEGVGASDISVDTTDGVVMLTGTAHSQAEKQLAIRTARSVKGVKAVEAGHLEVARK